MFKKYDPEKFKNIPDTCIPRALSNIYGIESIENSINVKQNWRQMLLADGFEYVNIPAVPFQKRMTVGKLSEINNKNTIIICSAADHVVFISGNDYYDAFDSGDRCVFYYFRKETK